MSGLFNVRAVRAVALAVAEEAARLSAAQRGGKIIEPGGDDAAAADECGDGLDGMAEKLVRGDEGLLHARIVRHGLAEPVVLKAHDEVGLLFELREGFGGLRETPFPLEGKGQGGKGDDDCAGAARHVRDERGRAAAGAAAESRAEENEVRSFDGGFDFIARLLGSLVADLGIASRAESARGDFAEMDFLWGDAAIERLHVGVQRDECRAFDAVEHEAVERAAARAAEPEDADERSGRGDGASESGHGGEERRDW